MPSALVRSNTKTASLSCSNLGRPARRSIPNVASSGSPPSTMTPARPSPRPTLSPRLFSRSPPRPKASYSLAADGVTPSLLSPSPPLPLTPPLSYPHDPNKATSIPPITPANASSSSKPHASIPIAALMPHSFFPSHSLGKKMHPKTLEIQRFIPSFFLGICCFFSLLWVLLWPMACAPSSLPPSDAASLEEPLDSPRETAQERTPLPERKPSIIGTPCEVDSDCANETLRCERDIPHGYCTRHCEHTRECPLHSACARITFSNGLRLQRCAATCRDERDCRPDFQCYAPPQAWEQICLPILP
jgi:hypothetical protein